MLMTKKTTEGVDYTTRLQKLEHKKWKDILNVQAPYKWNLQRLNLGRTLDVGCGIGRNLRNLSKGSVGVDHNAHSIKEVVNMGFEAYTGPEFHKKFSKKAPFDSMLIAHVLEHMTPKQGVDLIKEYLPYIKKGGKIVVICPQEKGYTTDETHITFLDEKAIQSIIKKAGLESIKSYSFPFHRKTGKYFRYNEFVEVGLKS